jgi:hypothetical protein
VELSGLDAEGWDREEVLRLDGFGEQTLQGVSLDVGESLQWWRSLDHADEELASQRLAFGGELE